LIRAARRTQRMSQRELAAIASVPHSTIGRIEAGSVDPRVGTFVRVLRVLGYQVVVTDPLGGLLEPVAEEDEPHDRAGRRLPAHLKIYKTPGYFDCDRGWWGWERIAWPFGPGEPPEYTYRLRRE
jgi:transcriptional regulator with XRE-family HTH domain